MQTSETLCNLINCDRVAFNNTTTTAEILKNNIELNYATEYEMIISLVIKKDRYKHIKYNDIIGKNRRSDIVEARFVSIYLCHKFLNKGSVQTGKAFGGRDHSTILHACKSINNSLDCIESGFGNDLLYLKKIIESLISKLKLYNVI